jgi:hypothetical protein
MNNHKLHKTAQKVYHAKPTYILGVALLSTVVCVFALRANNEHMIKLRDDVYTADKNNTNVTGALQNLQAYVTTHMNTNLSSGKGSVYPPIELKYTYQRLLDSESSSAAESNNDLYTEAQTYCQQAVPTGFSGRYRVPCIEQYVQTHDTTLATVPTELYEFDFVSPTWSPDLAGWSMFVAIISWIFLGLSLIVRQIYKQIDKSA